MLKIDSHQHFWNYDADKHSWINDDMAVLRRDYLPGDLKPRLDKAGFDGCVAVQADQSEDETESLLELAELHSFILGVVGWLDQFQNESRKQSGRRFAAGVDYSRRDRL